MFCPKIMELSNINIKSISRGFLFAAFFLIFPLTTVYAAIDINAMLSALKDNIDPVIRLATAVAYVLGIWFMISAILELKLIGQSQGMMSQKMGLGGPIMRFAIGAALVYFPSTVDVAVSTLWGSGESIVSYTAAADDPFKLAKEGVFSIIKAVGIVSFIRGFVILSHSTGQHGSQPGTVGKGIFHIIGGILAINIVTTIEVLKNSLGFT
jgi:intracellular multiplication protein IcmC